MIIDSSVVDAVASPAEVPHQPADSTLALAPLRASVISAHSPSWLHTHRGHPDDDSADAPDEAPSQRQRAATGCGRPHDDSADACDEGASQKREPGTPISQLTPAAAGYVAARACTTPRVCDAADDDRSWLCMDREGRELGDQVVVENLAEPPGAEVGSADLASCGADVARLGAASCAGLPGEEEPSGADVAGVDMPSDAELAQRCNLWRDASIVVGMHPDQVGESSFVVPTFHVHTFRLHGFSERMVFTHG
jgi:hypothetical protein